MTEFVGKNTVVFPFQVRGHGSVSVLDLGPLAVQPIRLRIEGMGSDQTVDFGPREARSLAAVLTEHATRWENP